MVGNGDPNAVVDAAEGTPYWDYTNDELYYNTDGVTAWQLIGGGGGVVGSGVANRITFWSGANTLTSDAGLTVDAANDMLIVASGGGIGTDFVNGSLLFTVGGPLNYAQFLNCRLVVGGTTPPSRLLHVAESDTETSVITYVTRRSHTTSGAAAVLFGVGHEDELEDSAGNMQVASEYATLWAAATTAVESPLIRFRPHPKGSVYGAGTPVWSWDGVDGTLRVIIPAGAGDMVYGGVFLYHVYAVVAGDTTSGMVSIDNNTSVVLYNDGVDRLTLVCTAGGALYVQRTAGADTFNVVIQGVWQ